MSKTILIIGLVWPEPQSSAAGYRILQLVSFFQKMNYKVVFASAAHKSDKSFNLSSHNIQELDIKINNSGFDDLIAEMSPNIVMFDRFMVEEQFGWRVAKFSPNSIRILDTEDLHCLRKTRIEAYKNNSIVSDVLKDEDITKREIASIYRCDLSIIISEVEMNLLQNEFNIPKEILFYLPFTFNKSEINKNHNKFNDREDFIFIGNFIHEPNYNAVLNLKKEIWPLLRKLVPNAKMLVYGAYVSPKVSQLSNPKENFLIKGYAECVDDVMQKAKVCLVPLKFGAGLKGKIFDALKNNLPVVTTTIGAEGIYGDLDPNGFITDDIEEFVEKARVLYTDKEEWNRTVNNGKNVLNNRFLEESYLDLFSSRISCLVNNLSKERSLNFIGAMLQFHTFKSNKFMSKWIEEKNKTNE